MMSSLILLQNCIAKRKSNGSQCSGLMRLVNFSFVWRLRPARLANQPPTRKYVHGGKNLTLIENNFLTLRSQARIIGPDQGNLFWGINKKTVEIVAISICLLTIKSLAGALLS